MERQRYLVCITGASGAIYGLQTIRRLKELGHEVHLIVTKWGLKTLQFETGKTLDDIRKEVDAVYDESDLAAAPASGSYPLDGVIIVPCSMKTLAGVAHGFADNLVLRAADCTLKEKRRLILVIREAPYNLIHIRNMESVTEAGGVILPASPAFWHRPKTIEDLVDSIVQRAVRLLTGGRTDSIEWHGDL